ncbi:GNAT family N-acetyltransferase [Nocardioides caldifontis]|uniref:GNAT family N-acetyltransferase n=1 Tax=Nocardioides caldifontis TaxID=2588938 RepID=UPI001EF06068|nr:GNAT family N-acetyltransferase [Nocardioides caldifontis]
MRVRLVTPDDAGPIASLLRANREFLTPWEPVRPDSFFTEEGQLAALRAALTEHELGLGHPLVVLDDDGEIVGRLNVTGIVRGAFQSANLGYWIAQSANGRGLATSAVAAAKELAFGELGLHRLQAATLLHNTASQKVLERNGFVRIGMAPAYLSIAGRWQDHLLFQVLAP